MKVTRRKIKWTAIVVAILWFGLGPIWAYYDWPIAESQYVKVLGTRDKKIGNTDQRRIQTFIVNKDCSIDDSAPYVLANDDTLMWFKFDSEDLQAKAKAWSIETLGADNAPYVKLNYTGWRIKYISLFPNLIAANKLEGCPYGDDT